MVAFVVGPVGADTTLRVPSIAKLFCHANPTPGAGTIARALPFETDLLNSVNESPRTRGFAPTLVTVTVPPPADNAPATLQKSLEGNAELSTSTARLPFKARLL